jgi:lipoprotein-releasing system permease protein
MSLSYEFFIGRRYLRSARGNRFVSFISMISMAGIALGVAVLIVVLSVMNGFEQELRDRILSMTAHATITGFNGRLSDWQTLAGQTRANPEVVGAAPYIEGQAMLRAIIPAVPKFTVCSPSKNATYRAFMSVSLPVILPN